MTKAVIAATIAAVALLVCPLVSQGAAQPDEPSAAKTSGSVAVPKSRADELKALKEGLQIKQAELAKLRRKWTASKGRVPTEEELKEFEKKRAKGAVGVEDNPYVNKSPLGSPGYWRKAYYEKLEEVKKDREKITAMEKELSDQAP